MRGHARRPSVVVDEKAQIDAIFDPAAIKVQAFMRGRAARKGTSAAGQEVRLSAPAMTPRDTVDNDVIFDAAATKVQALMRGRTARKGASAAGQEVRKRAPTRVSCPPLICCRVTGCQDRPPSHGNHRARQQYEGAAAKRDAAQDCVSQCRDPC